MNYYTAENAERVREVVTALNRLSTERGVEFHFGTPNPNGIVYLYYQVKGVAIPTHFGEIRTEPPKQYVIRAAQQSVEVVWDVLDHGLVLHKIAQIHYTPETLSSCPALALIANAICARAGR